MKRKIYLLFGVLLCCCIVVNAQKKAQADVYIFLHTECPISQAAVPAVNHLVKKYPHIGFFSVFTHWDTKKQVDVFAKTYNLLSATKHDKKHVLVNAWSVTTTPEVVMLNRQGAILYRGLLDDSFVTLGKKRDSASNVYLENAIREYLLSGSVSTPYTIPVGCRIESLNK